MSIWSGPAGAALRAGAAAAADPPGATGCDVAGVPALAVGGAAGACGSGSRMSAPSPRPKAFLGIGNYLLCKLCVSLCALTVYIIENNRFTKTWCFGQTHIPGNQALEDLGPKEAAQVGGDLPGKAGPLVVHRQEYALYFKARVQRPANPHQGVKEFGNALECQVFALD